MYSIENCIQYHVINHNGRERIFTSVQLSHSVVSDSLRPHELQHTRPPCPSSSPGVHSDSRPSSPWYHPAISSSIVPFSSCPQSLPASDSFPMSQRFAWGGQSTGVSSSTSVLPMNIQDWFPLGCTGWISLQFKGLSRICTFNFSSSLQRGLYHFTYTGSSLEHYLLFPPSHLLHYLYYTFYI